MNKETYNIIKSAKEEYKSSKNVLTHLIKKLVLTSFNESNSFNVEVKFDKPIIICVPYPKPAHYSLEFANVSSLEVRICSGEENNDKFSPTDYEVIEEALAEIYGVYGEYFCAVEQLPIEAIYAILLELERKLKEDAIGKQWNQLQ